MRAVTIVPRRPGSLRLDDRPDPVAPGDRLLVKSLAVGICGTDRELVAGLYGEAPPGEERLVLGHESLGRVASAPRGSGFSRDDLVVGIVRHPDPVPCLHCAAGEWDMCANGRYTERGIRQEAGFASEYWVEREHFVVKVDPGLGLAAVLLEPASVLAKAWEHIDYIGRRARWEPERVLVIGAGPVGLLAALMGAQRGLEVHVQDHNDTGPKPQLAAALSARYFSGSRAGEDYDVVIECTGVPALVAAVLEVERPNRIVCLTGLSAAPSDAKLEVAPFSRSMVLGNQVVFGTVNANRRHYQAAAQALARAERGWLERLITRRVSLKDWQRAYEKRPGDVKTVLAFED